MTEIEAKSKGWDEAIDMIVNQLRKQIEVLHKSARETKRVDEADSYKFGVKLYKALTEQLKLAKGNIQQQKFHVEEVRALVDHLTGSTQTVNNSAMEYFDKSVLPMYMAGKLELKKYTLSPDEQERKVQDKIS